MDVSFLTLTRFLLSKE